MQQPLKILFLDDDPYRHGQFTKKQPMGIVTTCWTAEECITLLKTNKWDIVWLDHDLGEGHTGMVVVDFIVALQQEQRPDVVIIHSSNIVARKEMLLRLQDAGVLAYLQPL